MQSAVGGFVNGVTMAINIDSARFLLSCRRCGVSFESSLTLGRQEFYLTPAETRRVLREQGLDPANWPELFPGTYPNYADAFWRVLGARRHETMDASPYEGATLTHDLNLPVPQRLHEQFTAVCDGGTLEHVFDFPRALRNCLEMIKPGGHFLGLTPANNFFGHGLYQLSPELYFRALNAANGFQIERMYAIELGWCHRWFEVANPATSGARVSLINRYPVLLFLQAKKLGTVPLFDRAPQQSDYADKWASATPASHATPTLLPGIARPSQNRLLALAPRLCRAFEYFVHTRFNPAFSFRHRRSFRPIDPRRLSMP